MGFRLLDCDEGIHDAGSETSWNESRYVDFWDSHRRVGGWFRIGNRPNEGYAEVLASIHLPDGRQAFMFERPEISVNTLHSGNQAWEISEPWVTNRIRYRGEMLILEDPWLLADPRRVFEQAPRAHCDIDLICRSSGLEAVMGADQAHIARIRLPGQASFHYQHLCHTVGTVQVGAHTWTVGGHGGKDHSWGPGNWHARTYFRWLTCGIDARNGFMLVCAVDSTHQTRGGFVLEDGQFHLVDDFSMENSYGPGPNFSLCEVRVEVRSGMRRWKAIGTPQTWLPLRHNQAEAGSEEAIPRIEKSHTEWRMKHRRGEGMCEYHDLLDPMAAVGPGD